jgi:hypothetical protein
LLFRINQGDPATSFVETSMFGFAETDLRPLPQLGVSAGVRYDWQSTLGDVNNVAPRFSVAYAPGGRRTIIRAGFGRFFDDLPSEAVGRVRLFDGGIQTVTVRNPTFPILPGNSGLVTSSIWRFADDLEAPSTLQGSIGIERPLWRKTTMSAEVITARGTHLLRARNPNPPGSGGRGSTPAAQIYETESTGSLRAHSFAVTFRGYLGKFKGTINYTLSRSIDDTSGVFDLPADNRNLASERGRSDFDRRHRFTTMGVYEWRGAGLRLGTVATFLSGAPYDITTGSDDNGDLVANDRPPGVTRNTGQGPGFAQVDLRLTKVFRALRPPSADPESRKREYRDNLELTLDAFNVFNRTNLASYVGVISSPYFGRANAASRPRTLQACLRYRF